MRRRLIPLLAGIFAVCVFGSFAVGLQAGGGGVSILGLAAVMLLVIVALTRSGRGGVVAERSWSAPADVPLQIAVRGEAGVPSKWSVARALGRVEARELMASPWFGVGLGFCGLILLLFGIVWAAEDTTTWEGSIQLAPWYAHPLVGMAVLAAHRAVTRARRDGADELFDTCPADPTTRTLGFLWSAVLPVFTLTVFLTVLFVAKIVRSPYVHGSIGMNSVADMLGAVVLGAGGIALGVALGRWIRFGLAPVIVVVAIVFATTAINGYGGQEWNPLTALATAPSAEGPSPVFFDRPVWWHLLWLAGLTALVAVVAVARHRRDRTVALAGIAAVVVVVAAGIGSTRPMPAESAERIADLVANPQAHQECRAMDGPVEVCVYPLHHDVLDLVTTRVGPIAEALPRRSAPLTMRQVFEGDRDDLAPEVRRLVDEADLVRPAGEIPLRFGENLTIGPGDVGFGVAFAAVGLPSEPDDQLRPTVVAGQARGVVAIWLATRGLDADDTARASTSSAPGSANAFARGSIEPEDVCSIPAVVWSAQDLAAARAVLALPEADVAEVIESGWARWIDPGTGTDELLAELGLPGVGPFDQVEARPGQSC